MGLPGFTHLSQKFPVNSNTGALIIESSDPFWGVYTNYGIDSQAVVQAETTRLFGLRSYNKAASVRYLQIFNSNTSPELADEPLLIFPIPATQSIVLGSNDIGKQGILMSLGLAFGFSSTEKTFTPATAADHSTVIFYADSTLTVNSANWLL